MLTPRKIIIAVVALILVAAVIWFIPKKQETSISKITIAQTADFFLYAPVYIAKDAGFFKKNNLEVDIISTGGDEKTWAAVLSRNAAFGISDPTFIAISGQKGQPGKVIANIVNGVPFWGVTYQNIPDINDPHNLKAYSVATFPSPSTAYTLQSKMFKDAGLEPNIKEGAFGTLLGMLKAKQADIALELEPNVSQATQEGAKVVYSLAGLYGDFAITGLTATPQTITENPQLISKVTCALQQALNFLHAKPDSAIALLSKRFPELKKDVAAKALQRVLAERIIPADLVVSDIAWSKAIKLRLDLGELKQETDFSKYIDNRFAQTAKKCQ